MPVRSLRPARRGPRQAVARQAAARGLVVQPLAARPGTWPGALSGTLPIAALLVAGLLLSGCAGTVDTADNVGSAPGGTATGATGATEATGAPGAAGAAGAPGEAGAKGAKGAKGPDGHSAAEDRTGGSLPEPQILKRKEIDGIGPETRSHIPETAKQAVVVTGEDMDSDQSVVTLYERDPVIGWRRVSGEWPAHNAREGWTDDHVEGDLRSPIGVFDLTDAGGKLPDPGSKLPYDRGHAFEAEGTGFEGESLEGTFDYVIAINYNRVPGTTPLDWTRPLGQEKGGGIWLHVDHGGPTQGCVALPRRRMQELLRTLDPAKRPVVVMGDAASLSL